MTQQNTNGLGDENSQDESLTQDQLQQILATGERASQLLNSPVYNMAYQRLLNDKFQQWLATDPKEERKRESMHAQAKGLIEITELLSGAVQDAQRILSDQQAQNDPNAQHAQYMDAQGFVTQ